MELSKIPFKLNSTRVWRTYTGGKLLEQWIGQGEGKDGEYPEEWIASLTSAAYGAGGATSNGRDGLSLVQDYAGLTLKELIDRNPEAYLGADHVSRFGSNAGLLTKVLDSAERLTIQVHPDQDMAQKLFQSRFGKTEAWYILNCREIEGERPYVLLGFKEGVTREAWRRMFDEQDIAAQIHSLHRFDVEPGQVFLIEGGMPHAIGPGCLLIEIQEPTDLTLRTEKVSPKGREIPDHLCHLGLGFDRMFECFDYQTRSKEDMAKKYRLQPAVLSESDAAREKVLIDYEHTKCFRMTETKVYSETDLPMSPVFSVVVVAEGEGIFRCHDEALTIRQGEQIFLPASIERAVQCTSTGETPLTLIRCFPPV